MVEAATACRIPATVVGPDGMIMAVNDGMALLDKSGVMLGSSGHRIEWED